MHISSTDAMVVLCLAALVLHMDSSAFRSIRQPDSAHQFLSLYITGVASIGFLTHRHVYDL